MVQKGGAGHGKAIPCQRKTVMELSKMAILRVSRSAYATVSERRDKGGREKIGSKKNEPVQRREASLWPQSIPGDGYREIDGRGWGMAGPDAILFRWLPRSRKSGMAPCPDKQPARRRFHEYI